MQVTLQPLDPSIRPILSTGFSTHTHPSLRHSLRQHRPQRRIDRIPIAPRRTRQQRPQHLQPRRHIERHRPSSLPVRRRLQHRRPTHPPMRDQQAFFERRYLSAPWRPLRPWRLQFRPRHHIKCNPCQIAPPLAILHTKHQRHQPRTRLNHAMPKLLRLLIPKRSRTHLRNRQPTRSHHHSHTSKAPHTRLHHKSTRRSGCPIHTRLYRG